MMMRWHGFCTGQSHAVYGLVGCLLGGWRLAGGCAG